MNLCPMTHVSLGYKVQAFQLLSAWVEADSAVPSLTLYSCTTHQHRATALSENYRQLALNLGCWATGDRGKRQDCGHSRGCALGMGEDHGFGFWRVA